MQARRCGRLPRRNSLGRMPGLDPGGAKKQKAGIRGNAGLSLRSNAGSDAIDHAIPRLWSPVAKSSNVEAVSVHHLGPRRHEVLYELLLRVRTPIDFREGAKLRMRAEDQVDGGGGPLRRLRLAVAALVHVVASRAP